MTGKTLAGLHLRRALASPIRIEVPLPLALRSANAWLFPGASGQPPALVDCGIGTPEGRAVLQAGLVAAGVTENSARGLRLFVTHGHIDHAGNAAALARDHGAVLHAPRSESRFIETFRADASRRHAAFARALADHGCPPPVVAEAQQRGERLDAWLEDTPIGHDLHDGERVLLGTVEATAHHAPGHTPGSTVYLTADNDLLTGDTLLEHITSNAVELLDRDRGRYHQYLKTLDGLRRFVGCRALPGHHGAFDLTDALLDGHLAKHAKRSAKVLSHLDRPKTAHQLLPEVLPHLAGDQVFLGMCEVVGHLHHLVETGQAKTVASDDGLRRFIRA